MPNALTSTILRFPTATLFALALGISTPALAGKLYRWVDDQGQVRYGDQIPPQFARQRQDTLNAQGIVVETKAAAKTPEQIAEERRIAEVAAEEERLRQERAQHDRMLLSTFTSEDDIVMTRDGKIAAIEAAVRLAQARIEKANQRLAELTRRAADIERAGNPVSDELRRQIADARDKIGQNQEYVRNRLAEQEATRHQFELDLQRFRELKKEQQELEEQSAATAPAPSGSDQGAHTLVGK